MTNDERKKLRFQRRKIKRESSIPDIKFEDVISFEKLYEAGKKCCKNVRWKNSVIRFEAQLAKETEKMYNSIVNGTRKFNGFASFKTVEHGKMREINALPITERALQKTLNQNLLLPLLKNRFIYDNSASLEGKGMDFFLRRLKKHLSEHYRRYGLSGGIYKFDFKSYFASIPHENIKLYFKKYIKDEKLYQLICTNIDEFQYILCSDRQNIFEGVGLGSEISQTIALFYIDYIDHYIKDTLGIKGYGRYMDDGYIISNSLEELQKIKSKIYELAESRGLKMSDKKNIITPFKNHSFNLLKLRMTLTESGKVVFKLGRVSIKAMIRKLNIFREWVDKGIFLPEDVFTSYQSWRSHALRCNSYITLRNIDKKFVAMFEKELKLRRLPFPCTLKSIKANEGWIYK